MMYPLRQIVAFTKVQPHQHLQRRQRPQQHQVRQLLHRVMNTNTIVVEMKANVFRRPKFAISLLIVLNLMMRKLVLMSLRLMIVQA